MLTEDVIWTCGIYCYPRRKQMIGVRSQDYTIYCYVGFLERVKTLKFFQDLKNGLTLVVLRGVCPVTFGIGYKEAESTIN